MQDLRTKQANTIDRLSPAGSEVATHGTLPSSSVWARSLIFPAAAVTSRLLFVFATGLASLSGYAQEPGLIIQHLTTIAGPGRDATAILSWSGGTPPFQVRCRRGFIGEWE